MFRTNRGKCSLTYNHEQENNMQEPKIFGYTWEEIQAKQAGTYKPAVIPLWDGVTDYGCSYDTKKELYKMHPSGLLVSYERMCYLLGHNDVMKK